MRQRVLLAMALANSPRVVLADEPTTALDVTTQAQVLELFDTLTAERGAALVLVTHDLGVVAGHADRVVVMYAGRVVEDGRVDDVLASPAHPYTRALLASVPSAMAQRGTLAPIGGTPPNLADVPPGCAFHPRCEFAIPRCTDEIPELVETAPGHRAACIRTAEL
jgi:oligopeptide/dipeptide ABC transporter ATP-binding protein